MPYFVLTSLGSDKLVSLVHYCYHQFLHAMLIILSFDIRSTPSWKVITLSTSIIYELFINCNVNIRELDNTVRLFKGEVANYVTKLTITYLRNTAWSSHATPKLVG